LLDYISYGFYTIWLKEDELEGLIKFHKEVKKVYAWKELNGFKVEENIKICLDVANGYTKKFADFVKKIRELFPKNFIMAGNVATSEMTQELIINWADCIKLGIWPWSVCLTRFQTWVWVPQIETIVNWADSSHGLNSFICSDGWITCPGDVAKAFVAGADFIMIWWLFAGTDESDGEVIARRYLTDELDENDKQIVIERKFKLYYGMSSDYAQEKHFWWVKKYRTSEWRVDEKAYIWSVESVIIDILWGLRSACTYVWATKIKQISKCGSFIKVNRQHSRF
jgi:GMP reductase